MDGEAGARAAGVPIMGQVLTEQHDFAGGEMADVVAHEKHPVARGESRRFHLDVVMPMVAFTADAFGMAGVEQGLDFAEVLRPAEHPERAPGGQGNSFELAQHCTMVAGSNRSERPK